MSTPKPWLAALLNIVLSPFGLLYAGQGRLAILFFVVQVAIGITAFVASGNVVAVLGLLQIVLIVTGAIIAYRRARAAADQPRPWYARWRGMLLIVMSMALVATLLRMFLYEPYKSPSTSMLPTIGVGDRILVQKIGYGHVSTFGLHLATLPHTAALKRGDLIVFDRPLKPAETYIKRVVGLPGDRVAYRDGHLIVNGQDTRISQLSDFADPELPYLWRRYRNRLDGVQFDTLAKNEGEGMLLKARPEAPNIPFIDRCVYTNVEVRCDVPAGHYYVMGDHRDNSVDSRYFGFVRADQVIGKVVGIFRADGY
ncbi:signal peptidase I [Herbaspirillum sp. SJZ107]|uniref:signal peptidase I n=1 Tax=Herbaspirillum sp. SJZ107 TaxID=2572881 RepID=UPI0011689D80|nr:signal peptidase I [Herbaspirillum sp. SJZ107]TQK07197.1 signal peptidase I [Herbaspirillum sp. SJZ107]